MYRYFILQQNHYKIMPREIYWEYRKDKIIGNLELLIQDAVNIRQS